METKETLSLIFKPLHNIVGELMTVIGVIEFFHPELQSKLTWTAISQNIPWYIWLSAGLFVWTIGIVFELVRYYHRKSGQSAVLIQKNVTAKSTDQSGGNALVIGENSGIVNIGTPQENKPLKQPNIKIKAVVKKALQYDFDKACLAVKSDETTRLICIAKLIKADLLVPNGNKIERRHLYLDKLLWINQTQDEKGKCEKIIEVQDKTNEISVARYNNGIFLDYCNDNINNNNVINNRGHGVIDIEIMIYGRRPDNNNEPISPLRFNGYIYAFNTSPVIYVYPVLIFKKGNWRNDKEVIRYFQGWNVNNVEKA